MSQATPFCLGVHARRFWNKTFLKNTELINQREFPYRGVLGRHQSIRTAPPYGKYFYYSRYVAELRTSRRLLINRYPQSLPVYDPLQIPLPAINCK